MEGKASVRREHEKIDEKRIIDLRRRALQGDSAVTIFRYLIDNMEGYRKPDFNPNLLLIIRTFCAAFHVPISVAILFGCLRYFKAGSMSDEEVDTIVTPHLLLKRHEWLSPPG